MFCSDLWFWGFGGFRIKVRSLFGIWGCVCVGFWGILLGVYFENVFCVDFCDFWGLRTGDGRSAGEYNSGTFQA